MNIQEPRHWFPAWWYYVLAAFFIADGLVVLLLGAGSWFLRVGVCAALFVMSFTQLRVLSNRKLDYRLGWMDGRAAIMRSMAEAQKRGLSFMDFAVTEVERDTFWDDGI